MKGSSLSRRGFLSTAGTAAVSLSAASYARAAGANERLQVGIVGPGGRGRAILKTFFGVQKEGKADLVAVCDLWTKNRERGSDFVKQNGGRDPKIFKRLEDMIAADRLDAMIIATSDSAQARLQVQCLQAGKHVYCEKPF